MLSTKLRFDAIGLSSLKKGEGCMLWKQTRNSIQEEYAAITYLLKNFYRNFVL